MQITLMRAACNNGRTCPNINFSDRGTYVVQGYVVPQGVAKAAHPQLGEAVVEIPHALLPELTTSRGGMHITDHGTVLLAGRRVTDAAALNELNLPAGEDAIELDLTTLLGEVA